MSLAVRNTSFRRIFACFPCRYKALIADWDPVEARKSAEEDWERDSKGLESLTQVRHGRSMEDLAARPT